MFALSLHHSPYPQRQADFEPTWLNRFAERMRVLGKTRFQMRRSALQHVVERVRQAGLLWEQQLASSHAGGTSAEALQASLVEIRRHLTRHGFNGVAGEDSVVQLLARVAWQAQQSLGMKPHPPQIMGAYVMLRGLIAEMDTGEGKSLTAALAAACAALAGCKVHVVTVNDYLASRDAEFFGNFFAALGLTTSFVVESMSNEEKRPCYQADIVYCANKIIVFDYLRDRLSLGEELRPITMAIDALLGRHKQSVLLPGLQFAIVDEADSVFIDEARTPLVIAAERDDPQLLSHYQQSIALARQLVRDQDFVLPSGRKSPLLTEHGSQKLGQLVLGLDGVWQGQRLREEAVVLALVALHGFSRDIDYIVVDGKAQIVDENTGRVMPDRSWERGLQQLIEIKENIEVTAPRDSIARLSYQLFFRRYLNLAGMTGTCREVAGELAEVYGLGTVRIDPFKPSQRKKMPTQVFASADQRWQAVVASIQNKQKSGQPVLVGTRSIAASEYLAALLNQAGVAYSMLNAKQNSAEAAVVAAAGEQGQVTIATNMAGRGTDIKLGAGVAELGGLHVILTEGHDNVRVDRQLAGRCARQGDPGTCESLLSLEDEVVQVYPLGLLKILKKIISLNHRVVLFFYWFAQALVSMKQAKERRRLLHSDHQSRRSLSFGGVAE